ncbi:PP-loop domain protein [Thermoanaerobacter mathranii subsp. mathranii str. A3]|uniref:PP-loop domain protein n=1 Tax=Thermoanaerobacter mathranii subsp. mathranii (strain DSM 11426 / CCUG 53645 / CIP 108742 / A3) TaxID=583358 RepID=A0ABM5LNM5_THEM3|nr:TIGR00269 family protein [Thermoanaerobacter mathranii]ADH60308.1 PP-loop domain protein [Thermoanaerobacter mathranii subsp. mathranii str. A3]
MKCVRCKKKAVIVLRRHNAAFCADCFLHYYKNQVLKNIRKNRMFEKGEKVLVVVSGGKDSMALWDILVKEGYNVVAMYINLGIGEYSNRSQEVVEKFAKENNLPLIVKDIKKEFGLDIYKLSKTLRRSPCSVCGSIKRYLFNKVAYDGGFSAVATGHNLDDEAATLFGNVLNWEEGYLARQGPVLPQTHPKLIKKVKPLYTLTERENMYYVLLNKIEFLHEECPHSVGARSILYKEVLNKLEEESPGTKQRFLSGFLEKGKKHFQDVRERLELKECKNCGQVTTTEECSFCRFVRICNQQ